MSCLLNQEMRDGLFVMVASDLFTKAKGDEPLDLDAYIREVYNFAKISSQGNEALALDAAMLVPGFVDQTLANRPKLEEHFEKFNEDIRMEVLAKKKAFRSIDKVRELLGLTESPAEIIDAVEQHIKTEVAPEPVIESQEKQEEKAEPWVTLPLGAFFTYGPEVYEGTTTKIKANEKNIKTIQKIREMLLKQGVSDSSTLNVPGVGPLFLKIMQAGKANQLTGRPAYTHQDKGMIAVLVDKWGDPVSINENGEAVRNKEAEWFKLYSPVPLISNAGGELILDLDKTNFIKHVMASEELSTIKDRPGKTAEQTKREMASSFYNTVMTKYKAIKRQAMDAGMSEMDADNKALHDLTQDFAMFEHMRNYVEKEGNTVEAVITGASKGIVFNNQYNPTPLKQVIGENQLKPVSVKVPELGMNLPEGGAYFYYPGISQPITIDKPSVKDMPQLMETLVSLFTEPLTENGKPMDVLRRNTLISQFLLPKYSTIRFVPNTKDGGFTHENGQFRVLVDGVRYEINYTESGTASRQKLAEAIRKAFSTPTKGGEVPLTPSKLKTERVVPVTKLEGALNTNNVLQEGNKYYRINFPHVDIAGKLIDGLIDVPTVNNGVVTVEQIPYNEYLRKNFNIIASVSADNKIESYNPVLTFAPTIQEMVKFLPGAKVQKQVEDSQKPVEKTVPTNTAATQSNTTLDDLSAGFTMDKRLSQKATNAKVVEAQIEAARVWYNNSPLKEHFPFETVFRAVNQGIGSVAQWSIHGIRLFHYFSEDGVFDASKSGDFTDLYHEAWHGFTQTFLTPEQRTAMYAEARKRSGSFVDYNGVHTTFAKADVWQLEEFLAEEFREYMISGGKKTIKGSPATRSIFKQILDFLKALFGKANKQDVIANPMSYGPIFEMYEKLRVGDLSSYNFDVNNRNKTVGVLKSLQARDGNSTQVIDIQDANMLVDSMDSIISKFATYVTKARGGDRSYITQMMATPENRKSVYNVVLQELLKLKNSFIAERDALSVEDPKTSFRRGELAEIIKTLEWATGSNFGDINNLANNKDNKGLIAYHAKKSKYLSDQDKENLFDEEELDETKQNMEARGQSYDRSGNEVSQYDLASPEIKYLLRSIHKFDSAGLPVKNRIGIHELAETHVVWNKIARTLNGIMDPQQMWEALDKAANVRNANGVIEKIVDPTLSELLDKLGSADVQTDNDAALWIKFWSVFNMASIPLIQMTVETIPGKVTETDANGKPIKRDPDSYKLTVGQANSASSRTVRTWKNNFRNFNTEYILRDLNEATADNKENKNWNRNYLDIDKVIKDFSDSRGALKNAPDFLRAIGISISDKPVINAAINSNVGKPAVIFSRLKKLSAANIKTVYSLDDLFAEYPELGLPSDNANLTTLGDLENKHSDYTSNYAQTNAEGNTQYELSLHNTMSIMVATINSAPSYQALINIPHMRYLDITKNPFAASSLWLNSIFTLKDERGQPLSPEDPRFGVKRMGEAGPAKLNMSNLSGVQMVTETGTDGISSAGADEFTKMIMDFHMTLKGRPELMRHADKGTSFSLWIQNIVGGAKSGGYVDTTAFYTEAGFSKVADMMMNYLSAELERIQKLKEIQELAKKGDVVYDATYLEWGQKFVIFEDILTPSTQEKLLQAGNLRIAPENLEKIRQEIIEYFEDQYTQVKEVFEENAFIDPALAASIKTQALKENIVVGNASASSQIKAASKNRSLTNTEQAMVKSFVANSWIHNIESMNIIYGDVAQYKMSKEEFHKRNAGAGSTGNLICSNPKLIAYANLKGRKYAASKNIQEKQIASDGSFQTAVLADNEIPSAYFKEIHQVIADDINEKHKNLSAEDREKKIKEAVKAYKKMTEGDAQGWITFDFYRQASILEGKWSSKQEAMYQAICNGTQISKEDAMEFFPTKKYQYWGPVEHRKNEAGDFVKDESGFLPTTAFHKFSLFPLIPNVIEGTNLQKLHEKMMKQGIDYAVFQSGSKISTLTKLSETGEKVPDNFYSEKRKFDETSEFTPNTIYLQFLKNQLEIAPHFKEEVTFPTQMRKLIENGLMEGGVPIDFERNKSLVERQAAWNKLDKDKQFEVSPYYQLIKRYEANIAKLTKVKKEALIKEANIQYKMVDGKRVVQVDKKLIEFIQGELSRQEIGDHEIAFLKTKQGGTGLAHDLSISLSSEKLEKMLNAIVVKRLVKQKFKGEGLIQVSGAGWETNLRGELSDEEKLKYGTNELPFYTREIVGKDKDGKPIYGKTKAMKVKIAMQGDFRKLYELLHNDGQKIDSLERLNEMLKSEEWLNKGQHRDMVSITGPRIPTQENNSMEFAEVYEFLPEQAGNIVVLPSEIVAKSGGDFDIDKITFMFPTIKAKTNLKDIDFKMFGDFHNKTEDEIKALMDKKKSERTEEEQSIFDHIYNYYPKDVTLPMDTTSEEGLENRILKNMRDILALGENYKSLVRPNGIDLIEPIAKDLADKVMAYKPKARLRSDKKDVIAGTRIFEIRYNLYKHASNNIGKQTLGLGAVDNTYNTVFNRIGMRMNHNYTTKGGVTKELTIKLPHNTVLDENGNKAISLSNLYDATGQTSISSVVAQLINGWVDIAKDAWIFNIQGNKEVSPTLLFMIQAGVPVDQAIYMVSHPLIRKYVEEQKLAKSLFAKTLGKGEDNPLRFRNAARRVVLEELFGAETANTLTGKKPAKIKDEKLQELTNSVYSAAADKFSQKIIKEGSMAGKMEVTKNLYDAIGKKDNWNQFDQAIFLHFLELEEMSKVMTKVKMNTNFDTSRSTNLFEAQKKIKMFEDLKQEAMYPVEMITKIEKETPIGSFYVQDFQMELWQELFKLRNNDTLNRFIMDKMKNFDEFSDVVKKTFGDNEKTVNEFRNDLTSFIFQNSLRAFDLNMTNYKGLDVKSPGKEVKQLVNLKHGVFVKDGVIYVDKAQLEKDYASLQLNKYKYEVTLQDGTTLTLAPVKKADFQSPERYYAFVFEREVLRNQWTNKWDVMKERADAQLKLEAYRKSVAKLENETDAHFEARVNTMVFEELLRDMALDNTFNEAKIFNSRDSMADQLTQIQKLYPELLSKYSLLQALSANRLDKGANNIANIMLNDSMLDDAEKVNIYHQNLVELMSPSKIKINTESVVERERVADFFNRLTIYSFLQSGMNTKGMYSLIRLVPQEKFTDLMTSYIPNFTSNVNYITLERYWKRFKEVNSNRRTRTRMRDYTIKNYNMEADYKKSGNNTATLKDIKDMIKEALEEKAAQAVSDAEVTYSKDLYGNTLYNIVKLKGRVSAQTLVDMNPDTIFVANGAIKDGQILTAGADTNQAALIGIKSEQGFALPTRASYKTGKDGYLKDADVLPDGQQPVEGANGIASTGKTQTGNQPAPINSTVINPALKQQIDSAISTLKDYQAQGKKIAFPKAGFGQYMIGADDVTGELKDDKIVPIAPAAFVYLSQQLWDNFKFVNPNFDKALGFTKQANVLQANAEVTDLDVLDALSFCFKA